MTRYPVDRVLAKIAEAKEENIYLGLGGFSDSEITRLHNARNSAFEMCKFWIDHYILTEQFDDESEATHV